MPWWVGTSFQASKLVRLRKFATEKAADKPMCVVVGAIAHGAVDTDWTDEDISVSQYAMSAAGVCAKLTDAFEEVWGIH
jgi:rRNA small subunit pseudouridine methyltransferase Nep1